MGAWGPAIFSDDVACDVRDRYRELIEDQVDDDEAEATVLREWAKGSDPDDGPVVWLALAATQHKLGRLSDGVRDRALTIIDHDGDAPTWAEAAPADRRKRTAALAKLRDQLTGPQPDRRRLRRPKQQRTGLELGDVLALTHRGVVVAVRVATMLESRSMQSPVVAKLASTWTEIPSLDDVAETPDGSPVPQDDDAAFRHPNHLVIVATGKDTWEGAGLQLLGRLPRRPGDDDVPFPIYLGFGSLAFELREIADHVADGSP